MKKRTILALSAASIFLVQPIIYANSTKIKMYLIGKSDQHRYVGTILAKDSKYGLMLTPHLHSLPSGVHGFHVHEYPSCAKSGKAAGGHLDPYKTNKHLGPYNEHGHLGDLPVLYVDKKGDATIPVLAPRLKVSDILNHSIMIHAGGDNYADSPMPLGGGGARFACGVIANTK